MKALFIVSMILTLFKSYAQDKIMVATSTNETYIETYRKSNYMEPILDKAYRLGPTSTKALKEGIRTAINWINLNTQHKKAFEKEICRFKAMDKELYKSVGYIDEFAVEMTLTFRGYSDGTFLLVIKEYDSLSTFIMFIDIDMVNVFRDLLDGKSPNKEIDDIFKK